MGYTVLHGLAAKGKTNEIRQLVDNDWVPVSLMRAGSSSSGLDRLHSSSRTHAHTLIVTFLLYADAENWTGEQVPWEVDEWGCNALHYAAGDQGAIACLRSPSSHACARRPADIGNTCESCLQREGTWRQLICSWIWASKSRQLP